MNCEETAKAIRELKIQGAQQIALSAAKSLKSCRNKLELKKGIRILIAARPTEPALRNALAYATRAGFNQVRQYFKDSNEKIALYGSRKIKHGYVVFTHCHSSTVVQVLVKARKRVRFSVHNTETRPFLQGRITARELSRAGIKVTHFVDSAARLALKGADIMMIGCDAVTAEGFIVNKIGSEMFAEIADSYQIPVYVCTNGWKYDGRTSQGWDEVLESRFSKEVWPRPPRDVQISNRVFEIIHPRLITGVISEFGITTVQGFIEQVTSTYQWISQAPFFS